MAPALIDCYPSHLSRYSYKPFYTPLSSNAYRDFMPKPDAQSTEGKGSLRRVLSLRDFRLFFTGEAVSLIGDQFYFIALPWLVLVLTGDPLQLGIVLALAAVPRAVFILVGGAYTDRFSPRTMMIVSNLARVALVGLLAFVILGGIVEMWMVYVLAFSFGVADAFFYPASMAIVPRLVGKKDLQGANMLVMGAMQLSMFAGPVLAGVLIAYFATAATELDGIGYALLLDAVTFVGSMGALAMMSGGRRPKRAKEGTFGAIRRGFAYVWGDLYFRAVLLTLLVVNFLMVGPLIVGIPVLADERLGGAAAFGLVMTAFGGGSLLGTVLGGLLPRPEARFGKVLLSLLAVMGASMAAIAFMDSVITVSLAVLAMGAANGYVMVVGITWFQTRTDERMMGRMMSVIMFTGIGIEPISMLFAGFLVNWQGDWMFFIVGMALVVFTACVLAIPRVRNMGFGTDVIKMKGG